MRRHARDEFLRAERFGDVVIGAQFEAAHAIGLFAARRQHHDRRAGCPRFLAHGLAHEQAVHARQHQIEQHEIGGRFDQSRHHGRAGGDDFGRVTGVLQVVADQFRDVRMILDDQDAGHAYNARSARPRPERRTPVASRNRTPPLTASACGAVIWSATAPVTRPPSGPPPRAATM